MDLNIITLRELADSLPTVFENEVYKENNIGKHIYTVEYIHDKNAFRYTGKLYILDLDIDSVKDSVSTTIGTLNLTRSVIGVFARGDLKGRDVCITGYELFIDPKNFKKIARDVNILKLKNQSPDIMSIR